MGSSICKVLNLVASLPLNYLETDIIANDDIIIPVHKLLPNPPPFDWEIWFVCREIW